MNIRLRTLVLPFALIASAAACGGGDLSVEGALRDNLSTVCNKAHDCRDSYPGTEDEFIDGYAEDAAECFDDSEAFIVLAVEQYEDSIEAGRLEFDSGNAEECIDFTGGLSCEDFWDPETESPTACQETFNGLVEDGGECENNVECENLESFCNADGICEVF